MVLRGAVRGAAVGLIVAGNGRESSLNKHVFKIGAIAAAPEQVTFAGAVVARPSSADNDGAVDFSPQAALVRSGPVARQRWEALIGGSVPPPAGPPVTSGDTWTGTNGNDVYIDKSPVVFIYGLGGNDSLTATQYNVYVDGGTGNDTITDWGSNCTIYGGASTGSGTNNDLILVNAIPGSQVSSDQTPLIYGGDGNDTIGVGGDPRDVMNGTIYGGAGDDVVQGGAMTGSATVYGDDGNDILELNGGDNHIYGGAGNDTILASSGVDTIDGGSGADSINSSLAGNPTVTYGTSTAAVNVNLATGVNTGGDAQGDIFYNVENISGSALNDTITGDGLANVLDGGAGNDTLIGGDGNDTLIGGVGADSINGGLGSNTASYASSTSAVGINLFNNINTGGDAAGVSLSS